MIYIIPLTFRKKGFKLYFKSIQVLLYHPLRSRHGARRDEIIFSFAGRRRQTKTISPFGQEGYHFSSYDLPFFLITASQSSVLFAHRRLPMGKKRKTLCVLCGSVVKYSIKDT